MTAPVVVSAVASAFLLTATAALAAVLGAWRFAADPGWTTGFSIQDGLLSHYQLWVAIAISAQMSALLLRPWADNSRDEGRRRVGPIPASD